MTEIEWLSSSDPARMLEFLRTSNRASERKLRLFAVACCRRIWEWLSDKRSRSAVQVAERYADGLATPAELAVAKQQASTAYIDGGDAFYGFRTDIMPPVSIAPHEAALHAADPAPIHVRLVIDHAASSNFRPRSAAYSQKEIDEAVAIERAAQTVLLRDIFGNPFRPQPPPDPTVIAWNDGCVVKLATGIYEERDFSPERMGVLADALEEAGVTDEEVLGHLRGPGSHCRGCWLVDLIVGKQ